MPYTLGFLQNLFSFLNCNRFEISTFLFYLQLWGQIPCSHNIQAQCWIWPHTFGSLPKKTHLLLMFTRVHDGVAPLLLPELCYRSIWFPKSNGVITQASVKVSLVASRYLISTRTSSTVQHVVSLLPIHCRTHSFLSNHPTADFLHNHFCFNLFIVY